MFAQFVVHLFVAPSSALPSFEDGQERQVGAAQEGSPSVLEDVADGPRQPAFGVVQRSHKLAVQSQLQDQSVAWQQKVVPAQRNHLETMKNSENDH